PIFFLEGGPGAVEGYLQGASRGRKPLIFQDIKEVYKNLRCADMLLPAHQNFPKMHQVHCSPEVIHRHPHKEGHMAGSIKVKVLKDAGAVAEEAAKQIAEVIKKKPNAVIGLATGSTPEGTYAVLAKMYKNKEISFARVVTFNL